MAVDRITLRSGSSRQEAVPKFFNFAISCLDNLLREQDQQLFLFESLGFLELLLYGAEL